MSIYAVREGAEDFSNVKSLTLCTLELVDYVHKLAVSTGGYGVGEFGIGAGE